MIYYILRPIVRIALILYFRKIYIHGLENIPKDKSIILVCNHPTAFVEPCMLACFLPRKLHFLVRGDLFSVGWLAWLLNGTNQIPIFRQQDGLDNVKKNAITQDKLFKLFQQGETLLMFPEAHTHENIYLKPLKKGVARFALMDHGTDLQIIPVGVNFDKNVTPNSKVSIKLGSPISVNSFKNQSFETEAVRIKELMAEISKGMKSCLRHIDDIEKEAIIHKVFRLTDFLNDEPSLPLLEKNSGEVLREEKTVAHKIDKNNSVFQEVSSFIENEFLGENLNIKKGNVLNQILSIVMLPILGVSLLVNGIPILIVRGFVHAKVSMHEFKSPVFLALMIFLNLIIILLTIILSAIYGKIVFLIFILYVTVGILGNIYIKFFRRTLSWVFLNSSRKKAYNKLNSSKVIQKIIE